MVSVKSRGFGLAGFGPGPTSTELGDTGNDDEDAEQQYCWVIYHSFLPLLGARRTRVTSQ